MASKQLWKINEIHEESERRAYCYFINKVISRNEETKQYLPIDPYDPEELYSKVKDGVLLCKLVNAVIPDALDDRAINKYTDFNNNYAKTMDNLCLAIYSARCRGANMGFVDINNIHKGDKCTILDTISQIIRISCYNRVSMWHHPEMILLKHGYETLDDFKEISPSDILLRYINFHIKRSNFHYFISDFECDFKDCLVYAHLTYRVAPKHLKDLMTNPRTVSEENCIEKRINYIIKNLEILNCNSLLTGDDLLNGFYRRKSCSKLHIYTMMNIFHYYPGDMLDNKQNNINKFYGSAEESDDEIAYRNFLNSFNTFPFTNHLFADLRNGLILKQIIEIIQPSVSYNNIRFTSDFDSSRYYAQRVGNAVQILKLLRQLNIVAPFLTPEKLAVCDRKCILFIMYNLAFRYFCGEMVTHLDLLTWVNCELKKENKKPITSFVDYKCLTQDLLAQLIELKAPNFIDKSQLGKNQLKNYRYLISVAHKAGLPIYTLPEHFLEGHGEFISLAFATIMMY